MCDETLTKESWDGGAVAAAAAAADGGAISIDRSRIVSSVRASWTRTVRTLRRCDSLV